MDPLTITVTIGAIAQTGKYAFDAAAKLSTFIQETRNVSTSVRLLASEIEALGNAYATVHAEVRAVAGDYESPIDHEEANPEKSIPSLWKSIEAQAEDCKTTIKTLDAAITCLKHDSSNFLKQGWRQCRLDLKSGQIDAIRSRVQSHTFALQLFLQALDIRISHLAPKKANQALFKKIDELQASLLQSQFRPATKLHDLGDSFSRSSHVQWESKNAGDRLILDLAKETLSSAESLYEASLADTSTYRAAFIENWVMGAPSAFTGEFLLTDFSDLMSHSVCGSEHSGREKIESVESGIWHVLTSFKLPLTLILPPILVKLLSYTDLTLLSLALTSSVIMLDLQLFDRTSAVLELCALVLSAGFLAASMRLLRTGPRRRGFFRGTVLLQSIIPFIWLGAFLFWLYFYKFIQQSIYLELGKWGRHILEDLPKEKTFIEAAPLVPAQITPDIVNLTIPASPAVWTFESISLNCVVMTGACEDMTYALAVTLAALLKDKSVTMGIGLGGNNVVHTTPMIYADKHDRLKWQQREDEEQDTLIEAARKLRPGKCML